MVKQAVLLPLQLEVEEMTGNREIAVLKRDKSTNNLSHFAYVNVSTAWFSD